MKMRFITKIQGNMKSMQNIHTRRQTSCVLDGSYASVFKGKSMNFDELREYVAGDDVKDIDWKATSRSGKVLVRQYVAEKKHNIMFLFDTNRRMLGNTKGDEEKRELAIMAAGTLAMFVNRNDDYIATTFMDGEKLKHYPFKTGLGNIEILLEDYYRAVTMENHSDLNATIEYVLKNYNRKMIVFIVSDLEGIHGITEQNLRRLKVSHDVLALYMSDANLEPGKIYDLGKDRYVDDFFSKDKKLQKIIEEKKLAMQQEAQEKLKRHSIANEDFDKAVEVEKELISLLGRHKFEKR
ncbi:MAG: DUF58 domain-containing protein [Lachnospiraceae bacterium]|nr:DUF58 domain-containing protein [Lachnospiraceae bacterium]